MKNLKLVAIVSLVIVFVQNLNAQQNWEIKTFIQHQMGQYEMSNHAAINSKYRGDKYDFEMAFAGISAKTRLVNKLWLGVEFGRGGLDYTLDLDRDFGDLDRIINFSQPTIDGDYENIDKINYSNKYNKWAINLDYQFFETGNNKFKMTAGLGLEQHRSKDSEYKDTYRDFSNGSVVSDLFIGVFTGTNPNSYSSNNSASISQKSEAVSYYNNSLAGQVNFINLRFGTIFQPFKNFTLSAEPTIGIPTNSYHGRFMDLKPTVGFTFGAGIIF